MTEEHQSKNKPDRVNLVLYGLIAVLILFGAFVYIRETTHLPPVYEYSNGDSQFEVRKITDTESQVQFYLNDDPQPYTVTLRYGPRELEDVIFENRDIKQTITDDDLVYITFDPNEELKGEAALAGVEAGKLIANKYFYNIPVKSAVTSEYDNNTVVSCDNATKKNTVIWVKKGEETKVSMQDNCILVEGPTESDIVKAADRLALYLIGIMP